jgi:hypothetical protein
MITSATKRYRILFSVLMVAILIFTLVGSYWSNAYAQDISTEPASDSVKPNENDIEVINPYFSIEHRTLSDGTPVIANIINGPPNPPPEYKAEREASIKSTIDAVILPDFPSYDWVFGCSAVSGAMIASYYDRGAYPNMYAGTTNGGVMPVTDTSWLTWNDGYVTYPNNPLIASHNGVDGRTTRGSIDDYWVKYESTANDPYITGGWSQHTWGTAIGDYMKTSQSAAPFNNTDGSTNFFTYNLLPDKLTCSTMQSQGIANKDGTYGRKLFYEARGYSVSDCYNQKTDNEIIGGFSLANFQTEIDAGHPVLLNLVGHSIVGYGYNGSTIYIRDTWDNNPSNTYTMPWGGSYGGMELYSVSVVHLTPASHHNVTYLPMVRRPSPPNQQPTNILLSNSTIQENQPINTAVGTLTTVDPNVGDTFTYSLVSGAGDTGNASFNISGNTLRSSAVFDYESQSSYSVRIRTTDQGGLYFEKAFTITIIKVVDNTILNGDFELGPVDWEQSSTHGWDLILQSFPGTVTAYNGTWAAWLGGDDDEIAYIQQQVSVSSGLPFLSYWHWIASEDACGYDIGSVRVNGSIVEEYELCENNNTSGWVQRVVNLSAYAGTTVTVQLRVETDGSLNSNLFIDQVAFQSSLRVLQPIPTDISDMDASTLKQDVIGK